MVLSSYQFRRDIAVFQPSEELLGLFENNAPQSDWTLEIPRSGNNLTRLRLRPTSSSGARGAAVAPV
jgi:hypothetical protein